MKIIYILLGFICLALGIIGAALPILPTTPFLLAALFCFMKGSERLHHWFIQTALYRNHLKSFHENRSMSAKTKRNLLAFATLMLLIGFYFSPLIGKVVIAVLLCVKYWFFIFWIKTEEPSEG